ncbi:MAG: serine/threonine dehydratase [Gammaproteobacteria bacterium]|nr:serine/threonine dehydratase [Gammaproteobacteria bacterium]
MLTIEHIQSAQQRIKPYIHQTPIISSQLLNQCLGHKILFKVEAQQKVGAFKARGGINAVAQIVERGEKPQMIVANSSGNHAQAVAWAAQQFALPATIYMPANVSAVKAKATASYGANIELIATRQGVDEAVAKAAAQPNVYWIPPYNHIDVMAGQGTCALELSGQIDQFDALFAPCGGGGLLSGSYVACQHIDKRIQVCGVEPLTANDAANSRRAGKIIALDGPTMTLADGARTPSVGPLTFPFIQQLNEFYEAPEADIIYWTQWLTHLLKLTVEPTSAMTMFGVCEWLKQQNTQKQVVVILTGGNIDCATRAKIWQHDRLQELPSLQ